MLVVDHALLDDGHHLAFAFLAVRLARALDTAGRGLIYRSTETEKAASAAFFLCSLLDLCVALFHGLSD